MALNATLGTALDATSNPDPTSLTTKPPYSKSDSYKVPPFAPSAAWTSQGNLALFPCGSKDGSGDRKIKLHFVPSGGGSTTYTINFWTFSAAKQNWVKHTSHTAVNATGDYLTNLDPFGYDAIFIQLSSISAGTITIYYDSSNAIAG